MSDAFWQGFWGGVFELVALGVVAFVIHILYQRYRDRADARQELIDEIDAFSVGLYKPRKLYQMTVDGELLDGIADPAERERQRRENIQAALEQLIETVGRFRALQIKIVPLFGYHLELFGCYLAIWRYLKQIRQRMERGQSLFAEGETSASADAFFRLIDGFRYMAQVERSVTAPPPRVQPPRDVLEAMKAAGERIYAVHFGDEPAQPAT